MASEADYQALREDTNKTISELTDEQAEVIFVRAATLYSSSAVYAGARVLVLRPEWMRATELADYTQNEESEKLGQIAEAKRKVLLYWEELAAAAALKDRGSGVRSGRTTRKPARVQEYPGW